MPPLRLFVDQETAYVSLRHAYASLRHQQVRRRHAVCPCRCWFVALPVWGGVGGLRAMQRLRGASADFAPARPVPRRPFGNYLMHRSGDPIHIAYVELTRSSRPFGN